MSVTERKKQVSVLIPAYNEEQNIELLLRAVLAQRFENVELIQILVCSDASIDQTVVRARALGDGRIRVLENSSRLGANETQNRLLREARGDIIILLNADVALASEETLECLVKPLLQDVTIGIVAARIECLPPRGYFESILAVGHEFRLALFERMTSATHSVYLCNGRARAFSRAFAEKLVWPDQCPEDNYSYFLCQKLGFSFVYEPLSRVWFRLPTSFGDHLKQSYRFSYGRKVLERYFGREHVQRAYRLPLRIVLKESLRTGIHAPIRFLLYLLILTFSRISRFSRKNEQSRWAISKSSKQLYAS